MSEETAGAESASEGPGAGVDPVAVSLALGGADRDKANQFLDEQIALSKKQAHLVDLQAKELAHELKLRHWSLQLRHASAILKFALEVSVALVGVAIVCFLGAVVWNASHADGLVVESFTVPPDLAVRGLTGQAIAGQLMDKLSEMQSETTTARPARSYANNWDNNIKVAIPETGVSIGEVNNFLKFWLGHETHVSGDVWRTQNGVAITARTSEGVSNTVNGTEPDLDSMIQRTAEGIYGLTQSYRYAQYLVEHGRIPEAFVRFKNLATTGELNERGWGYLGWTNYLIDQGDAAEREHLLKEAQQYGNVLTAGGLTNLESQLGRPELARSYQEKADALLRSGSGGLDPRRKPSVRAQAFEFELRADYRAAAQALLETDITAVGPGLIRAFYIYAEYQVREHDVTGAGRALKNAAPSVGMATGANVLAGFYARMQMAQEVTDWKTVLSDAQAMIPLFRQYPGQASLKPTLYDPLIAIADAKLGQFADAEALISPTPADCYPCLMARGRIAAIQGQNARADWWYARAVGSNPSIPLAESEWGQVLLERGQPDAAIAQFALSNQKGPHFADPLEGWGEALMAKNQSHLALAKFAEAEKYAPNWGRLHLKWGEALVYAGKRDEAKAQFARAAQLDLTPTEKAELARAGHV